MSEVVRIEQEIFTDILVKADKLVIAMLQNNFDESEQTIAVERSSIPALIAALKKIGGGE